MLEIREIPVRSLDILSNVSVIIDLDNVHEFVYLLSETEEEPAVVYVFGGKAHAFTPDGKLIRYPCDAITPRCFTFGSNKTIKE